jgi:hypothetical protein
MADNFDDDRTFPRSGMDLAADRDLPLPQPAARDAEATDANDPDAVRHEIARTRARMSNTIGEIEGALQRRKDQIQDRLDFTAPVRRSPWAYAAGVFGAGLALGVITGGKDRGDDDDADHVKVPRALLEGLGVESTAALQAAGRGSWEGRARELMKVIARQEEEIRALREEPWSDEEFDDAPEGYLRPGAAHLLDDVEALSDADADDEWDEDWNFEDADAGRLEPFARRGGVRKGLAAALAAGVAGAVGTFATRMVRGRDGRVERGPRRGREYANDFEGRELVRGDLDADPHYRQPGEVEVSELDIVVDLEGDSFDGRGRARRVSPLAGAVAAGAAVAVSGMVARLLRNRSHDEVDVETELEDDLAEGRSQSWPAPASLRTSGSELAADLPSRHCEPADPPLM